MFNWMIYFKNHYKDLDKYWKRNSEPHLRVLKQVEEILVPIICKDPKKISRINRRHTMIQTKKK